ncbi:MAG: helix-turn-helix transcriptional regulator [Dermatophilaceae bacterium]
MGDWTFFTNHGHVLVCLARDPDARIRDLASTVGITERAAHRIVADLVEGGYLDRERDGRRNRYRVRPDRPLRHPVEQPHRVGEVLDVLTSDPRPALAGDSRPAAGEG